MTEIPELNPLDIKVLEAEHSLLEGYWAEDEVAINAAALAYEIALSTRYPALVKHPMH